MTTQNKFIEDLEKIYNELRKNQRKVVFESKTEKEVEQLRKLTLGWITAELNTLIQNWKIEEGAK